VRVQTSNLRRKIFGPAAVSGSSARRKLQVPAYGRRRVISSPGAGASTGVHSRFTTQSGFHGAIMYDGTETYLLHTLYPLRRNRDNRSIVGWGV